MIIPPKLIGHRGVRNLAPENTLESIHLAHKLGLNWVEIDVKISKDLIPILLHDETLERTTNGKGIPIKYTYNELKELDAGISFYKNKTEIFIPSLKDILFFSEKNTININIELKPNHGFEIKNVKAVAELLKNFNFKNQYFFSSFDWPSLFAMKEFLPNSYYCLLIDKFSHDISLKNIIEVCNRYDFNFCGFNKNILNQDILSEMKKYKFIITSYSEKNFNLNEAKELWSIGVDSLFIDDPSEFNL